MILAIFVISANNIHPNLGRDVGGSTPTGN
jgi:hypothetical protein